MGEAADIKFSPPVAVRTEPHPTKKTEIEADLVFSAKSCATRSWAKPRQIEFSPPVAVRTEPHPTKTEIKADTVLVQASRSAQERVARANR
jgi:hypothetical protein